MQAGTVTIKPIDPAELSPGEFAHAIRAARWTAKARVVVIDSLNGYLNAMPEERYLTIQLHELLTYLGQRGVATLLVGAHQGLIGGPMNAPVDSQLPGGRGDPAALLRSARRSTPGDFDREEARRRARTHDPGL